MISQSHIATPKVCREISQGSHVVLGTTSEQEQKSTASPGIEMVQARQAINILKSIGAAKNDAEGAMIVQESISKHSHPGQTPTEHQRDTFHFLYTIEPAAAALAALTISQEDIERLMAIQMDLVQALQQKRYEDAARYDVQFHLAIVKAGGNAQALDAIQKELPVLASSAGMLSFDQAQASALEKEHELLIYFLKQGDAVGANTAMSHHLYQVATRAGIAVNVPQPAAPYIQQTAPATPKQEATAPSVSSDLTEREMECLKWCAAGKTAWETGRILNISEWTVVYHLEKLKRKLGVNSKRQIIGRAIALGLVST